MKYKSGQKLVCTANGNNWYKLIQIDQLTFFERLKLMFRSNKSTGPGFNDIVTVDKVKHKEGCIPLVEWREAVYGQYQESCFEPLISDNILEAELASCREPDFI